MEQPKTIKLLCPNCGKHLKAAPLYREATTVILRKCQCRMWAIKITPLLASDDKYIHRLEWSGIVRGPVLFRSL